MDFGSKSKVAIDFGTRLVHHNHSHARSLGFILGYVDGCIVKLELLDSSEARFLYSRWHSVTALIRRPARSRKS